MDPQETLNKVYCDHWLCISSLLSASLIFSHSGRLPPLISKQTNQPSPRLTSNSSHPDGFILFLAVTLKPLGRALRTSLGAQRPLRAFPVTHDNHRDGSYMATFIQTMRFILGELPRSWEPCSLAESLPAAPGARG